MITDSLMARMAADLGESTGDEAVQSALRQAEKMRSSAFAAAYQEYTRLKESGEPVDPNQFCARYPEFEDAFFQLLRLGDYAEQSCALDRADYPQAGELFAGFRLVEAIGEGKFARVYRAEVPALGDRQVVVKVSSGADLEALIQGPLEHPNVVPANWVAHDERTGLAAIMMPYLGRTTLEHLRRRLVESTPGQHPSPELFTRGGARRIAEAIRDPLVPGASVPPVLREGTLFDGICFLAQQMACGLAHLHERRIQHRDLKPSNVLVAPDGRALLMDFNLAAGAELGAVVFGGTPLFMAPEQIEGFLCPADRRPILDDRADLFSFGVIVYELIAGRHPFCPEGLAEVNTRVLAELPARYAEGFPPLRHACPGADAEIVAVIENCLALRPEGRPRSAAEVVEVFASYLSRQQEAASGGARGPMRAERWRGGRWAAAAALLVAGAMAVAGLAAAARWPADHYQRGIAAYQRADFEQAVASFGEVCNAEPNNPNAFLARARAYQRWADVDADNAERHFTNAISNYHASGQSARRGEVAACLAHCYQRTGQRSEALRWYAEARSAGFVSAPMLNNLGLLWVEKGALDQALADLTAALQMDATLLPAYHNRAVVYWRLAIRSDKGDGPGTAPEMQLRTLIQHGRVDIDRALRGPESWQLYRDAALLYATRSATVADDDQKTQAYLRNAIQLGMPVAALDTPAFADLRGRPGFEALRASSSKGNLVTNARSILDPSTEDFFPVPN